MEVVVGALTHTPAVVGKAGLQQEVVLVVVIALMLIQHHSWIMYTYVQEVQKLFLDIGPM